MGVDSITLNPVGIVKSQIADSKSMPITGIQACIEVFPQFESALDRIEEYSHLWVLAWLYQAPRDVTTVVPKKVNPLSHKFGVFAIRSPVRPNPIALTLVELVRVEGNILYVHGLDAVDRSPILDIKPYFEDDIVFSPRTARVTPLDSNLLKKSLFKQALAHHGEICSDLLIAVRMAIIAESKLEYIKSLQVKVDVSGSPCLADTLQGLSRARLANPARFAFTPSMVLKQSIWTKGDRSVTIISHKELDEEGFWKLPDPEIFEII